MKPPQRVKALQHFSRRVNLDSPGVAEELARFNMVLNQGCILPAFFDGIGDTVHRM
jgi:hypothetical protein